MSPPSPWERGRNFVNGELCEDKQRAADEGRPQANIWQSKEGYIQRGEGGDRIFFFSTDDLVSVVGRGDSQHEVICHLFTVSANFSPTNPPLFCTTTVYLNKNVFVRVNV